MLINFFKKINLSLTGKVIIITLLVSGTGMCLLSYFQYILMSEMLKQETVAHLETSVKIHALELQRDFNELKKDTLFLAEIVSESSSKAPDIPHSPQQGSKIKKLLKNILSSNDHYESIYYLRQEEGRLRELASVSRYKKETDSIHRRKSLTGFIYSNMTFSMPGKVVISRMEFQDRKPIIRAMTKVGIEQSQWRDFVVINMIINSQHILKPDIAGSDTQFIVSDSHAISILNWGEKTSDNNKADIKNGVYPEIEAFLKDDNKKSITIDSDGSIAAISLEKIFFAPEGDRNFLVIGGKSSFQGVQLRLYQLRKKAIMYITISLLMIFTGIYLALSYALSPVKTLTKTAQRITEGNEDVTIEIRGRDEVARLAEAFKIMLKHLMRTKRQYHMLVESLDDQVRARTKELEATNRAMEKEIYDKRITEKSLLLAGKVVENTSEAVMITDESGIILDVNKAFSRITGYTLHEVQGKKPDILKSGKHNKDFYNKLWHALITSGHWQGEMWNRRKNGEIYPVWNSISAVYNDEGIITNFVSIHSDITVLKETERRLEHLAHYDTLTGLPNRTLLQDRLRQLILLSGRDKKKTAVIMLDLDGFKEVNDAMGHDKGDELLIQVASRLQECVRKSDTIARFGGDEFVVVLPNINSFDNLIWIAQNIIDSMNDPFTIGDRKFFVTASLGIAIYPDDGKSGAAIMKNADVAMHAAKEGGKNTFRFFKTSMLDKSINKLFKANEIRDAIENQEFILHFQPRFWTGTRKIHSMEALIRWEHPERGMVYPGDFIPLAEETGLITRIDKWVLYNACLKNKELQEKTKKNTVVSINLSAKDFMQHNLVNIIKSSIRKSGINPSLVELEITETVIMQDLERSIKTLERLKETGVTISVDDFGTGYSSLSYLKMFPIDLLKIDRSFVSDLPDDRNDMAVVEAIIAMGHALGLTVLAEGVETEAQLDFLTERGCDFVQGYYLSRPVTYEQIEKMLYNENS